MLLENCLAMKDLTDFATGALQTCTIRSSVNKTTKSSSHNLQILAVGYTGLLISTHLLRSHHMEEKDEKAIYSVK